MNFSFCAYILLSERGKAVGKRADETWIVGVMKSIWKSDMSETWCHTPLHQETVMVKDRKQFHMTATDSTTQAWGLLDPRQWTITELTHCDNTLFFYLTASLLQHSLSVYPQSLVPPSSGKLSSLSVNGMFLEPFSSWSLPLLSRWCLQVLWVSLLLQTLTHTIASLVCVWRSGGLFL